MATYVTLINWTDEGAHNFKDTVDNGKALTELVNGHGAALERIIWTLGGYDAVAIMSAPDDETAAAISLAAAEGASMRTTTLRAFESDEVERIVQQAR
ncbi:MAG: GYD domain-containing protein [Solirubrobacteraceae bacterium]